MSKTNRQAHRVKQIRGKQRITDYAASAFPLLGSRTAVKKAILSGELLLNDQLAHDTDLVKKGDVLLLKIKKVKKAKVDINIPVVFEDDYLIIVNKPAGIAVNGNRNKTVENALVTIAKKSTQADALAHPRAVHRIDVPTKGLVLLAKTKKALILLSKAFQNNQVKKTYWAIVHGKSPAKGTINQLIQGKKAITHYEHIQLAPSRIFKFLSLLKLHPVTGRTHQLRIHLQSIGHLIIGDKLYANGAKTILGKGLFLAACQLIFTHPITGKEVNVQIDPPARFLKLLERETARFKH
jgi:RluA family pseudouridine synthase